MKEEEGHGSVNGRMRIAFSLLSVVGALSLLDHRNSGAAKRQNCHVVISRGRQTGDR